MKAFVPAFGEVEANDHLKYSLAFLAFRLAVNLAYPSLIGTSGLYYFLLCSCLLSTVSISIISIGLQWRWQQKGTPDSLKRARFPSLVLGVVLIVDAGLLAFLRPDVQLAFIDRFDAIDWEFGSTDGFHCVGDMLTVQSCHERNHWHSFVITQVFQFVLIYITLLLLSFRQAWLVGGLCVVVYSAITLSAASILESLRLAAHVDLLMLIPVFAISLFVKYTMTQSKCTLLQTLEKQLIEERLLRCQAEFTCEQLSSNCSPAHAAGKCTIKDVPAQPNSDECSTTVSEAPCSARSAPAAFHGNCQERVPLCSKEGGGDCLPSTAVAWVENCAAPRSLDTLVPGERVLCFDNVGRGLTYATIAESHPAVNSASADWVMVTLRDGTQLQMTADHPLAVQPSPEHAPDIHKGMLEVHRKCIRAEELDVERDCLMVMKMEATPVFRIDKMAADLPAAMGDSGFCDLKNRWTTITVEQAERHELFVASRDRFGKPGLPIAVGSSDRLTEKSPMQQLCVKNSFLHGFDDGFHTPKRASSAPPSVRAAPTSACSQYRRGGRILTCDHDCVSTLSGTTISGTTESSGCPSIADFKFGCTNFEPLKRDMSTAVRLTEFIRLKYSGVPSVGSVHTSHESCCPCSFHFTWLRNPGAKQPCKASYMCEYCHDTRHHDKWRSKFRKRRHAQPMALVGGSFAV